MTAATVRRRVLGPDGGTTERLIAAWVAWETAPGAAWTAATKTDALHAAGLGVCQAHETIGRWRRAGYSVPDAIQAAVNDSFLSANVTRENVVLPAAQQRPGSRPPLTEPGDDMSETSYARPRTAERAA